MILPYKIIKRMLDLFCSGCGLLVLGPLLIFVGILIKAEDNGPIFYRGARVGLHGKIFFIFKFRSMVVNAERLGGSSTSNHDPRITRIGTVLRKHKIDELPQLINVLLGDMSLVGPRPEVKYYTDMYTEEEKSILTVRPGITDWASIWNADEGAVLAGADDPDKAYEELIRPTKLKLQLKYVREHNLRVDLKILLLTLMAVVQPESQAVQGIRSQKAD